MTEKNFFKKNKDAAVRIMGIALLALLGFNIYTYMYGPILPTTPAKLAKTSVAITNFEENSGGSGSIISSSKEGSIILTNKHVCNVILSGGYVKTTENAKYPVISYALYDNHDLCLVKIAENLKINLKIAEEKILYTEAYISGHPALLPHVVSRGNVSGDTTINVVTGSSPCEPTDKDMTCSLFGRKVNLKLYNATLVTGIILPGSSGSAVFNEYGELCNVVFAGNAEGFSYAYTVPLNFIRDFLSSEKKWKTPGGEVSAAHGIPRIIKSKEDIVKYLKEIHGNSFSK